jgi:hypothetical protein
MVGHTHADVVCHIDKVVLALGNAIRVRLAVVVPPDGRPSIFISVYEHALSKAILIAPAPVRSADNSRSHNNVVTVDDTQLLVDRFQGLGIVPPRRPRIGDNPKRLCCLIIKYDAADIAHMKRATRGVRTIRIASRQPDSHSNAQRTWRRS